MKYTRSYDVAWASVLLMLISKCLCDTIDNVKDLHDKLFVNSTYNNQIRGVTDQTAAVRIGANFSLLRLGAVLEKEEAFEVMGLLYLSWTDERLVWNPSDYNGTEELVVVQGTTWRPEVRLSNPVFGIKNLGSDRSLLRIYNTGKVDWMTPDVFQATCKINVVSFPWDRQSCSLDFVVSAYSASEVTIDGEADEINTDFTDENESWEIVSTKAVTLFHITSKVQFWVCLERRSSFQVSSIFMPIIALSVLNAFVFFVKVDSGERISFAITLLLSITLYLSLIANSLPSHSKGMSAIIYCLNFVLMESTIICILSIYSNHVYHKQGVPPSTCKLLAMKFLGKSCRKVGNARNSDDVISYTNDEVQDFKKEPNEKPVDDDIVSITWKDISLLIDRIGFCLSFVAIILSFIIFASFVVTNKVECK